MQNSQRSSSISKVALFLLLGAMPIAQAVAGTLPVFLGSAGNYTVLAKSTVTTTGTTSIVGDVGLSPAAASYFVGFGEALDSSGQFSTSSLVNGKLYASDYAPPTPSNLTTAIGDMQTAYTDAAGRAAGVTGLGAGDISGLTLAPNVYKWGTGLAANTDVTLSGSSTDVWIFQIDGNLTFGPNVRVVLAGGALAKNIFWQVAGATLLDTTTVVNGNILCQTGIAMNTGAVLNGKALAQTAVTLQSNTVTSSGNPGKKNRIFAFPSPAKGLLVTVAYFMAEPGKADVRIYNEIGDLVASAQESKSTGPQNSPFSIKDFAPGIYLIKVHMTYNSGKTESPDLQKFAVSK